MALVGGAAIVWSTGGLLARLVEDTDKWTTIFWRSGSAFAFLFLFILVTYRRGTPRLFREMGLPGLAVAACFTAASIGLVVALSYTSVAQTLIIMSSTPLLAALFGRVFLGETIRPATWGAIAAVMAGIALMVSGSVESSSFIGDLFAAMIAVAYAGAIVISRRYHHIQMLPASCLGVLIAMILALPLAVPLSVTAHDLPVIFVFGAGQLGVGLALFVTGVRLIPASHSAILAMLEPILGPIWVWLALAERPAPTVMIGGAIVLASILAKTLVDLREQQESVVAPG
jgi:drug/metabolite transporter (DMT)-like permease